MSQMQDKSYGIKTRYSPDPDEDLIADIIFVHGLTGSADSTWAVEKDGVHWPSQFLCQDIKDVRISTFGYDADVVSLWNPVSQNRISSHAENMLGSLVRLRERTNTEGLRIIFVAHSLGGLVVESALDVSRGSTEPHLRDLETCTAGICFLGTPHLGSDLAQWGRLGALFAKTFRRANTDIIKVLSPGSEMLAAIQGKFFNILNHRQSEGSKISITCFYEELAMPLGGLVVPEPRATLPGYSKYGIHANHREMTRFKSRSNTGYIDIVGELQRWTKAIRSSPRNPGLTSDQEVLTAADCLKSLHFPSFTLRQDTARDATSGTFEWIWSAKDSCFEKWLQSRSGIFWISGKPGSGKTTMVKYLIANRGQIEQLQTSLYSQQKVTQATQRSRGDRDLILAAHFFNYEGDHLAYSVTGLLRSLLFQLLRARPQLFEAILPRYEEMKRFHTAIVWSDRDLSAAFKAMLRHSECGPVIFFIDALDEAEEEHDEIIRLIAGFSKVSSKDTQFCVSSRPSADFSFYLADPEAKIRLDEYSSQDIHHFVRESFQELASRFNKNYRVIINQIVLKAENVFLWARLVVENLLRAARRRETIDRLLHRLLKMPTQLNHFYRHMIDQVSDYERFEVLQILGIVLSMLEPLSIEQLQDVMEHCSNQDATQEPCPGGQQSFHSSLNSAEHFAERIESICFGLVEVRTTYHRKETRRVVVFLHHTVNEFLETLDDKSETQDRTTLAAQGNLDLLSACVDCMVAVNTSEFFKVISIDDEQLRRQALAGENTSSASKLEWPRIENQHSWTEAELHLQAFVICPFLRYAASHWAQHAKAFESEIGTSCHTILSRLTPINFRLWSLLMRRSDESWNGIEGRQIVTPSTLLEYATLFGLTKFVEEELQSSLTNTSKTSQLKEHQFSDLKMIYGRLLYAAGTGGNVAIAEALMVWGAKFETNLCSMPDALSRAIFRGNLGVASVFCDHGALSNVSGVYLEGFKIQSQYRTPDIITMRIADQPSQLEATPMALMTSVQNKSNYSPINMFRKCADFDTTTTPASFDYLARLTEWDPEIAIDDFAVAFDSPYRNVCSTAMAIDQYMGEANPKQRRDKVQRTYVLDEDTESAQDGCSMVFHVLTVKLVPTQDVESSLVMLMKYKGAYGRLPKLDITSFNLTSSVSLDLTKRLLDLGYSLSEQHRHSSIFICPFSIDQPISSLADDGNQLGERTVQHWS